MVDSNMLSVTKDPDLTPLSSTNTAKPPSGTSPSSMLHPRSANFKVVIMLLRGLIGSLFCTASNVDLTDVGGCNAGQSYIFSHYSHYICKCSEYVSSPTRTIVEALICIGLIMAYLPQYLNIAEHGTASISSWFVLWTSIFSSLQFATYLTNEHVKAPFHCVKNGTLRDFKAFSAVLGHIQAGIQWVCAMIYLLFYIKYRTQIASPEKESTEAALYTHLPPSVSSHALEIAVITQTVICVGIGLGMLMWPDPDDEAPLGEFIIYIFFTGWTLCLFALASLCIAIYQYIPQIRTVIILKDPGSISIPSTILQVVFFLIMGTSQALRLGLEGDRPDLSHRWFYLYLDVGTAWVPYIISAVGQVLLLGVCSYYTRHRNGT